MFSIMTSYARARAESLIQKCKVGFMERPERIVLFMIGAFTNRMAGVVWVILSLSVLAAANRIYFTYLALNDRPMPSHEGLAAAPSPAPSSGPTNARRCPTDLWVIAILRVRLAWSRPTGFADPTGIRHGPRRLDLQPHCRQLVTQHRRRGTEHESSRRDKPFLILRALRAFVKRTTNWSG